MSESISNDLTQDQIEAINRIAAILSAFKVIDGKVIASPDIFGDTLPQDPVEGQIFFLLES
jgi:hypothetical protein